MKMLLNDSNKYYSPKKRPSGHDISNRFAVDNGGAIPPNLLQIPNTESNSQYLRLCNLVGTKGHPARFPQKLPEFFIHFLTDVEDVVLDVFAGSNTTGAAAEELGRQWIAFELKREYLATSIFRFLPEANESLATSLYHTICVESGTNIAIPQVIQPRLLEEKIEYVDKND
jgi:site-specific DNA-methyltransferase (cytosine-N4-specific)